MQRIRNLSWILLIVAVVTGVMSYAAQFIHFNERKPLIISYIKQISGLEGELEGDVGISILPPAVTLAQVKLYDLHKTLVLSANEIRLDIKMLNLLSGIKSIDVKDIAISRGGINLSGLVKHMSSSDMNNNSLHISSIVLEKCHILASQVNNNDMVPYRAVKDLNASITYGALLQGNDLNITSDMLVNNVKYDFNGHFENIDNSGSSSKAEMKFSNDAVSFDFNGSLKNLFISPELGGKISSQILNIDNFKHIIEGNPFLLGFFKNNQLQFAADFSAGSKIININNITIASRDIQNLRGNVEIDLSYGMEIDARVSVDKIDIDSIKADLPLQQDQVKQGIEGILSYIVGNFDFNVDNSMEAVIAVDIKEVAFNGDKIKDINGSVDIFDGNMLINNISAHFPGDGKISLDGKITHNSIRPLLGAKVMIEVPDFIKFADWATIKDERMGRMKHLVAAVDLELIPHHLTMNNIRVALGDIKFVGNVIAHDDANSNLSFNASMRFNQLNFDDLQVAGKVDELLYNLFISDFDKTGGKFSEFTKDLRWLRTWKNALNLELIIDKIIFKQQEVNKAYISLKLTSNNLIINRISVDSDDMAFHGNISMTMPVFRPYIAGKIVFDRLNVKKASLLLPDLAVYRKTYRDSLTKQFAATPAKDSIEEQDRKNALELSTYEFNFLGATNYDVDMDIGVSNMVLEGNASIKGVSGQVKLLGGIINIKNLVAQAFEGTVEANASVVVVTPVPYFNTAFALINVQPSALYQFVTGYQKAIDGYLSASGQLSARGINTSTLYDKLAGKIEVAAKRVSWSGFSLSKVIESVESQWEAVDKMKAIKYYTRYGDSMFDSLKGTITVTDGVANTNNIVLRTDRVSAVLAASYAVASKMCNAVSRYAFIPAGKNDQLLIDMQSKGEISQMQTDVSYDGIQKYLLSMVKADSAPAADNSVESILRSRRGG